MTQGFDLEEYKDERLNYFAGKILLHSAGTRISKNAAYALVAYRDQPKNAYQEYARKITKVISNHCNTSLTSVYNQGSRIRGYQSFKWDLILEWLNSSTSYWVHFFINNPEGALAVRTYICCNLSHTHDILDRLLQHCKNTHSLYFKIAAHPEAQKRNDTIVAWHTSETEADHWLTAASTMTSWLEGEAPYTSLVAERPRAVGKALEYGTTETTEIAKKAIIRAKEMELERKTKSKKDCCLL